MEVTRARFGSLLEWGIAALCALALTAGATWTFRGIHTAGGAMTPVAAQGILDARLAPAEPPAAIPSKAVFVPLLLLRTGSELRVGDVESAVAAKVQRAWRVGADALERASIGNRITRTYDEGGRRFMLVFEPPAGVAERRVSAIYVQ